MGLDGPAREIIVEPITTPGPAPATEPVPDRRPAPDRQPVKTPDKEPVP